MKACVLSTTGYLEREARRVIEPESAPATTAKLRVGAGITCSDVSISLPVAARAEDPGTEVAGQDGVHPRTGQFAGCGSLILSCGSTSAWRPFHDAARRRSTTPNTPSPAAAAIPYFIAADVPDPRRSYWSMLV